MSNRQTRSRGSRRRSVALERHFSPSVRFADTSPVNGGGQSAGALSPPACGGGVARRAEGGFKPSRPEARRSSRRRRGSRWRRGRPAAQRGSSPRRPRSRCRRAHATRPRRRPLRGKKARARLPGGWGAGRRRARQASKRLFEKSEGWSMRERCPRGRSRSGQPPWRSSPKRPDRTEPRMRRLRSCPEACARTRARANETAGKGEARVKGSIQPQLAPHRVDAVDDVFLHEELVAPLAVRFAGPFVGGVDADLRAEP